MIATSVLLVTGCSTCCKKADASAQPVTAACPGCTNHLSVAACPGCTNKLTLDLAVCPKDCTNKLTLDLAACPKDCTNKLDLALCPKDCTNKFSAYLASCTNHLALNYKMIADRAF